ncbi:type IV toxin-antitoxin system AbiEi family antitoxin domain-containing protein [Paramesorhizobium deserti]|uniref:type IV toxin-antitoxin system AbiEi family antitoxin domain-containing protein n=1 Tax=Paramesorhizobium deserti TaxID=1494590 RepID=UPI0009E7991A|nr:type IV toxin-antitoxin system AbiEi family antitoxin domain-containing protein [Paramesorhizobium deserti]
MFECLQIRVKRLFLVFAHRPKPSWRERLNPGNFMLDMGDRALVKGGKNHSRQQW